MNPITIEETLTSDDISSALTVSPYLIYSEILEGARRPLVFLQVVKEVKDLIGKSANRMQFLKSDQLGAHEYTETQMLAGMDADDKNFEAVEVTVYDLIWSAVELSDMLTEDYPEQGFAQFHVNNMGKALTEFLDALVYTTLDAAIGTLGHNCANLDYDELIDALTVASESDWNQNPANPPFLLASPATVAELLKDTKFTATERYTTAQLSNLVEGEQGLYAGCRVLKSSLLTGKGDAFIVFPSDDVQGIVVALVYKRDKVTVTQHEASEGKTYMNSSLRATPAVVQALGIVKIQISSSP